MFIKHLFNNKTLKTNQDDFCEFIFLLVTIYIDGTILTFNLIYQENIHDLQDIWLEIFNHSKEETRFAVSKKNWTNDELKFF